MGIEDASLHRMLRELSATAEAISRSLNTPQFIEMMRQQDAAMQTLRKSINVSAVAELGRQAEIQRQAFRQLNESVARALDSMRVPDVRFAPSFSRSDLDALLASIDLESAEATLAKVESPAEVRDTELIDEAGNPSVWFFYLLIFLIYVFASDLEFDREAIKADLRTLALSFFVVLISRERK